MDGLLQSVPLSPVPLDQIIRRGKGVRLGRAAAAAGGLGLAGIVVVAVVLALRIFQAPAFPVTNAPSGTRAESVSSVIASGQVSGQDWSIRLTSGSSGDCYAFEWE